MLSGKVSPDSFFDFRQRLAERNAGGYIE